jgi:hypothetical protein
MALFALSVYIYSLFSPLFLAGPERSGELNPALFCSFGWFCGRSDGLTPFRGDYSACGSQWLGGFLYFARWN